MWSQNRLKQKPAKKKQKQKITDLTVVTGQAVDDTYSLDHVDFLRKLSNFNTTYSHHTKSQVSTA